MSANNISRRARIPLFLFLLSVLAFNISTIPGQSKPIGETSLSSEFASTCDEMQSRMNNDDGVNEDSCTITPLLSSGDLSNVVGEVSIRMTNIKERSREDLTKIKSTPGWQATLRVVQSVAAQQNHPRSDQGS